MSTAPAFDELVAQHHAAVLRTCRALLRDEHLGADAAQEAFVRLYQRLRERSLPENAGAWLSRVAVRASIDLLRRRRAGEDALSRRGPERAAPDDPEADARADELRERFERAVGTLSEAQRTVFLLRHRGGLSLAEVADVLGVALPTAKTHFARACLKLQESLRPFDPTTERGAAATEPGA